MPCELRDFLLLLVDTGIIRHPVWALSIVSYNLFGWFFSWPLVVSCHVCWSLAEYLRAVVSRSLEFSVCVWLSPFWHPALWALVTWAPRTPSPISSPQGVCWPPLPPPAIAWKTPGSELEPLYGSCFFSISHGPLPFIAAVYCLEGCCFIHFV